LKLKLKLKKKSKRNRVGVMHGERARERNREELVVNEIEKREKKESTQDTLFNPSPSFLLS